MDEKTHKRGPWGSMVLLNDFTVFFPEAFGKRGAFKNSIKGHVFCFVFPHVFISKILTVIMLTLKPFVKYHYLFSFNSMSQSTFHETAQMKDVIETRIRC